MMFRALMFLTLLAMSACGFQLRGTYVLPDAMSTTYVSYGGTNTAVRSETVRALNLNDVTVVKDREAATAILEIQQASTRREILSRDRNGRPQEYDITVAVKFRVLDREGVEIVEPDEIEVSTVLVLDTTNPTATRSEREAAEETLRESAVMKMVRAISVAARRPVDTSMQ